MEIVGRSGNCFVFVYFLFFIFFIQYANTIKALTLIRFMRFVYAIWNKVFSTQCFILMEMLTEIDRCYGDDASACTSAEHRLCRLCRSSAQCNIISTKPI